MCFGGRDQGAQFLSAPCRESHPHSRCLILAISWALSWTTYMWLSRHLLASLHCGGWIWRRSNPREREVASFLIPGPRNYHILLLTLYSIGEKVTDLRKGDKDSIYWWEESRRFGDHVLKLLQTSVQFSHWVVSNSLWPHGLQHARPPCPSPTPRVYSNSRASSQWCHPTISSSVVPFSTCLQSFPPSGSFPMKRWPKYWSFSFSISSSNAYSGLISFTIKGFDFLAVQGTLKSLLQHHSSKASVLWYSAFFICRLQVGKKWLQLWGEW